MQMQEFVFNYVINLIDKSNPTFTVDDFLTRIFDPDFVESQEYVAALVGEIPKKKLGEILISIFRERRALSSAKVKLLADEIIKVLSDADINDYVKVISDELQKESDQYSIILEINMIHPVIWKKVRKTTKIRIENKVITSIKKGEVIYGSRKTRDHKGVLGTWVSDELIGCFEPNLQDDLSNILRTKINDSDIEDNLYVVYYFLPKLPSIFSDIEDISFTAEMLRKLLYRGGKSINRDIYRFTNLRNDQWKSTFIETLSDLTDADAPSFTLEDGTPFLGKERNLVYEEDNGDDIPF